MNDRSAPVTRFRVPAQLITLMLLLAPAFAQAKSEYRACMEAQQLLNPFGGYSSTRTFRFPATGWSSYGGSYYGDGYGGSGYYSTRISIGSGLDGSSREADRISAMARKCRQFRKTNPPNFRVLTIKSHALKPAVNGRR
jgi:hypothetical protein